MSTVRMCDRCTEIFSERADGWSNFSGSTIKRDPETGKTSTIQDQLDLCPDCTFLQNNGGAKPTPPRGDTKAIQREYLDDPELHKGK